MGFFSWQTSDTKETIWNKYTGLHKPVYMLFPNGREPLEEPAYDGYGGFAGTSALAILAKENFPDKVTGDDDTDRDTGAKLFFDREKYKEAKFQLKFSFNKNAKYEDLPPAESDPHQGYFA